MNIWDQLVDCICRPPRDVYSPAELLGGSNQTFMVGAMECTRLDYELVNKQGMKLQCSHYLPLDAKSQDDKLPVVVYCHCNSGSRRDAEEALYHLLPCGVGVVAFDFTGSGLSDGKWVTLGAHEVEDLAVVVQHLRSQGGVSSIGLWGRSMGAVTALMYSHLDPDIAGMVLDSPFSRLTDLMLEIVVSQRLPIPKMMLKLALRLMRNSVRRKAGCDINTVSPLDVVPKSAIPAMFGHGEEDSFINIQHSVKLYEAYNITAEAPVYKNLVRFKGDHNHPRPAFFYSSVCCFFHQQLKLDQVLLGGNPADTQQLMQYGSLTLSSAHLDRANGFINTPWSLEPVSSLSPEDQAAAAAATLLAEEAGANCAGSNGSNGGSAHAGDSSSTAAAGSGLAGLSHPPRIAVQSRAGAQGGGAGVVHISEGGLNSPRASPRDKARMLVSVDASASSSGSSGGGRHAGARAAGMGRSSSGGLDGQQMGGSAGPGSPISPLHQQQQHRQRHHHPQRHQQHAQQQHSWLANGGTVGQDGLWQPTAAVPVPAAGRGQASGPRGVAAQPPDEQLFTIGSRGAPTEVLQAHERQRGSATGSGGTGAHLSKSAPESHASAGTCAAGAGTQGQHPDTGLAATGPDAVGERRGSSSGGSFVAAGGQHLKRLFRRSNSGTPGSTPSTSPPVNGADIGAAAARRPCSSGCHLGHSGQQELTAGTAGAGGSVLAASEQQQGWPGSTTGPARQAPHQSQEQQQPLSRDALSHVCAQAAAAGACAAAVAIHGGRDGSAADARQAGKQHAVGPGEEEDFVDPDLAAAIAASLADQQQQQLQGQQGLPQQVHLGGELRQEGSTGRVPNSLEEEERMLREAIALSLAVSGPGEQPLQEQQAAPASAAGTAGS